MRIRSRNAGSRRGMWVVVVTALALWSQAASALVIGSYDGSRSSRPFLGSDYSNLRSRLTNPANFGPGGVVNETVSFAAAVNTASPATLAGTDLFFITEVSSLAGGEVAALHDYVLAGGCLVLVTDSSPSSTNAVHTMLQSFGGGSVPGGTAGGGQGDNVGTVVGAANSSIGPFGNLLGLHYDSSLSARLQPAGPTVTVGITDPTPWVNLGEIPLGALGAGAGGVLAATDVLFMNYFIPPASLFGGSEVNASLILNFVAAQANGGGRPSIPEPGTLALLAGGLVAVVRRRRR